MNNKEIFLEIENHLLNDDKPSIYLDQAVKNCMFDNYPLSMIKELKEVKQNPKFHPEGNVFIHTMMVVDEGAKHRNKSLNKRAFMWALLLHDIGKKPTTKVRNGKLTSYDHDKVGENMAKEFLKYFNEDDNFVKEVTSLVRWHMQSLFVNKGSKFQNIDGMLKDVDVNEISLVTLADRLGRGKLNDKDVSQTIDEVENFRNIITKASKLV